MPCNYFICHRHTQAMRSGDRWKGVQAKSSCRCASGLARRILYVQEGRGGGRVTEVMKLELMLEAWQKIKITDLHPGELQGIALPGNSA